MSKILLYTGVLFMLSPFILFWLVHGDYDRYFWIIHGPFPFSHMGGGPFQLLLYSELFLIGIVSVAIYFYNQRKK